MVRNLVPLLRFGESPAPTQNSITQQTSEGFQLRKRKALRSARNSPCRPTARVSTECQLNNRTSKCAVLPRLWLRTSFIDFSRKLVHFLDDLVFDGLTPRCW